MKAILKLHLTPVRMALITNTGDGKSWGRWDEPLSAASVAAVEVSTKVPKKTKTEPLMAQVITQGVDSKNARSQYLSFLFVAHTCVFTCTFVHVWRLRVGFLHRSSFYLLVQGFLLNLELTNSG